MTKRKDLSYFGDLKYPSDPEIRFTPTRAKIQEDENNNPILVNGLPKCSSANIEYNCLRNHHGTHMDMPSHKNPGGETITDYDLDKFTNQCMMIDLTNTDILKRREIPFDYIRNSNFKILPYLSALILYTGYGDLIEQNTGKLTGQAKKDFEASFPYLSQETANQLTGLFPRLNILGIDSWSVDKQGSNSEIHKILFANKTLPLETLVGLKQLIPNKYQPFTLYCYPIKIPGGDAAWVRAYAEVECYI